MIGSNENAGRQPGALTRTNGLQATPGRAAAQDRIAWKADPPAGVAGLFFAFLSELDREAAADPEPPRSSPEWKPWQARHWEREGLRGELLEAQALTVTEDD